ncbi:hypothetical protein [Aeoliella sp.]|uniref:hypothetical protein n=1 Tax=Aeoliella sp. TaxID=2795800 RepID=UPI003CCB8260
MSSATVAPLSSFTDWLQDTDDHAAHHLAVIDRVSESLDSGMADPEAARELSDKLERWRYQLLSEHAGRLAPRDAELAVALNATSNVLADRAEFDTRATHHAVHQAGDEAIAPEAVDAIDPEYPLEPLISRARQTTAANFAGDARTSVGAPPRWSMLLYAPLYVSSRCVSAGSSTIPGGYGEQQPTRGEQFPVTDHRSPREVADWLAENGFEVDWKPGDED